ncbi:translation initiation factor IF-2-like [Moschus berezovskii]|uniref:translation initiation factor IF-2-like n=1 Tax=Moschus berezovskii TaxID=68408 RepID=UPI0024450890|nr:translation initiation factor IF-2-like [Moschus berezovskii]
MLNHRGLGGAGPPGDTEPPGEPRLAHRRPAAATPHFLRGSREGKPLRPARSRAGKRERPPLSGAGSGHPPGPRGGRAAARPSTRSAGAARAQPRAGLKGRGGEEGSRAPSAAHPLGRRLGGPGQRSPAAAPCLPGVGPRGSREPTPAGSRGAATSRRVCPRALRAGGRGRRPGGWLTGRAEPRTPAAPLSRRPAPPRRTLTCLPGSGATSGLGPGAHRPRAATTVVVPVSLNPGPRAGRSAQAQRPRPRPPQQRHASPPLACHVGGGPGAPSEVRGFGVGPWGWFAKCHSDWRKQRCRDVAAP